MIFLSLLSITLGSALQTVYVSTLVALFAPQLALRGPDGSLHDAVEGMHKWNSVVLALFFTSLFLLQLSAFSFMYGHSQLSLFQRCCLCVAISLSIAASVHYARLIILRLSLPKADRVTGAFFRDRRYASDGFVDNDAASSALSSSRMPAKPGADATRIAGDDRAPLTAEALDAALMQVRTANGAAHAAQAAQAGGMLPTSVIAAALQPVRDDEDDDDDEGDRGGRGRGGGRSQVYESDDEEEEEEALLVHPGAVSARSPRGDPQQARFNKRTAGRHEAWRRQAKRGAAARARTGEGERRGLLTPDAYVPEAEEETRRRTRRPWRDPTPGDVWKAMRRLLGREDGV